MGYRPRIQRAAGKYDLPLPVMQCTEDFPQRIDATAVPLQPGALVRSVVRDAARVTFNGLIVVNNPQDANRVGGLGKVTDIIAEKELLTQWLVGDGLPFTFYRFVANAEIGGTEFGHTNTRFYKNVVCVGVQFGHTNTTTNHLPYSFTLLVPDGVEYYV